MLEKDIQEALKEAMKAGQKVKVSVLRMLTSEVKNKKIEDRTDELGEDKIAAVMRKMAKRYKESIEKFSEGGRGDLVEKESAELAVLEEYLPEQLSEGDIVRLVDEVITDTGASSMKDMGRVMGGVLERAKGCADGSVVSRIVKEKLAQ